MAFVTGTANTLADLLAAIQTACIANGWTLSGNVLHKGTCYVELKISGSAITIRGGSGVDGGNNLTGACNTPTGNLLSGATGGVNGTPSISPSFPLAYDIHVHGTPDEVYVVANYSAIYFEIIGFGQSNAAGLVGTGNWYCGTARGYVSGVGRAGEDASGSNAAGFSLFCRNGSSNKLFGVDHQLDSATWAVEGAWRDWSSLYWRSPSLWNQESILIPIRVYASRPSGYVSPVLECAHARYVSIANLANQQIITLGSNKWKVYPWWSRGLSSGGSNVAGTFSGVCGHAIRYDGP